jgi:hypothetical protein
VERNANCTRAGSWQLPEPQRIVAHERVAQLPNSKRAALLRPSASPNLFGMKTPRWPGQVYSVLQD